MVDRADIAGLPVERIRRILAPFDRVATDQGLSFAIEAPDGTVLLGATDAATTTITHELRVGGALLGRVIATSAAAGTPAIDAAIEAIATGIEELAELDRAVRLGGAPAGTTDPATLAREL